MTDDTFFPPLPEDVCVWEKPAFCVIGRLGSTADGEGFVRALWQDANAHFGEIAPLALRRADGSLCGIWGAMSSFDGSFSPWAKDFSEGLYLAGVECPDHALPPPGWVRWRIPGMVYLRVLCGEGNTFRRGLTLLSERGLTIAAAAQDLTHPAEGKDYICFPFRRL